ncbi:Kelch repeat-containing protein [Leptospira noguchii]|uniref:Kelch repeat-containing protein n=1 Tax=Leptospira noguchii TaxID=28182 RepID=UPI000AAA1113|nr:kelch repeat-containing protein [Leptospira noguchii]
MIPGIRFQILLCILVLLLGYNCKENSNEDLMKLLMLGIVDDYVQNNNSCNSEFKNMSILQGLTGRYAATGTVLNNGEVAFIGGEELANPISNRVELFNGSWNQGPSLNQNRQYHSSTPLNDGNLLVIGGYDNVDLINSVEKLNINTNTWNYVAPMNVTRALHQSVLLGDGQVLVVGGNLNNPNLADSAELYDYNQNQWIRTVPMNSIRSQFTLTRLNDGRVIAVGGMGASTNLDSVEIFNPNTNNWTQVSHLNQARLEHSAILLSDGRLLVAGGRFIGAGNISTYLDSMEIYDPSKNVWTLSKMPVSRTEFTLNHLSDGSVLFIGGRNVNYVNENYRYFPNTNQWCSFIKLEKARYGHLSAKLSDHSILIYGGSDSNGYAENAVRLY